MPDHGDRPPKLANCSYYCCYWHPSFWVVHPWTSSGLFRRLTTYQIFSLSPAGKRLSQPVHIMEGETLRRVRFRPSTVLGFRRGQALTHAALFGTMQFKREWTRIHTNKTRCLPCSLRQSQGSPNRGGNILPSLFVSTAPGSCPLSVTRGFLLHGSGLFVHLVALLLPFSPPATPDEDRAAPRAAAGSVSEEGQKHAHASQPNDLSPGQSSWSSNHNGGSRCDIPPCPSPA